MQEERYLITLSDMKNQHMKVKETNKNKNKHEIKN